MDWKIELVAIPVTDVDRAKAFMWTRLGFTPITTCSLAPGSLDSVR